MIVDKPSSGHYKHSMAEQISFERLSGLIAFAKAGTLGSYSAAARALSVSPSAVSKSVQRLEQQLGVPLFIRTTRSLSLTTEGRNLHERAVRLLQNADELEQVAAATRAEPAGVLKVTAPLPLGANVLAPALRRFRERYPKLSIDLRLTDRLLDIVDEGIDLAVRVGHLPDSRLIALPLGPHRSAVFASPAYLAKRGTPLHPNDIEEHDIVNLRYENSGQTPRWPFRIGATVMELNHEAGIIADSSEAVAKVIAAGGGIGITPTYVAAPYVERGELVPVLGESAFELVPITALWPESGRGTPNVKAFASFLSELFSAPTPWDLIVTNASGARAMLPGSDELPKIRRMTNAAR
jgi:DNA-binding transcriptional LysR family regulator